MSPASTILSPLANPFYPTKMEYDGAFSFVYYDGIPTGIVDEHEVLANIPDEALDEVFPPSACDAAEMDAVDDFLKLLVSLSIIEDMEEMSRFNFGSVAEKRWEAKRKEGLKGRPYLSSGRVERVNHEMKNINLKEQRLIHHTRHLLQSSSSQHVDKHTFSGHQAHILKRSNMMLRHTKCIQQPRKQH